jgi:hypothetical protein
LGLIARLNVIVPWAAQFDQAASFAIALGYRSIELQHRTWASFKTVCALNCSVEHGLPIKWFTHEIRGFAHAPTR